VGVPDDVQHAPRHGDDSPFQAVQGDVPEQGDGGDPDDGAVGAFLAGFSRLYPPAGKSITARTPGALSSIRNVP